MPHDIDTLDDFLDLAAKGGHRTGLLTRNYSTHPSGYYAVAPPAPDDWLVSPSEYASRLKDQQDSKTSLFDLRTDYYDTLKSLDQNGYGLCWAFSSTKAAMYLRVRMGDAPERLSAWWVAGKVKGWRDQGGWGAESTTEISQAGVPTMDLCPSYKSSYDSSTTQANAALHKITKWYDGTEDRARNEAIMISAFLLGLAPVLDYDWLGHSMCGCRLVSLNPTVVDCDNSWGENSGTDRGLMRLTGSKAIPDGIVVPIIEMAA